MGWIVAAIQEKLARKDLTLSESENSKLKVT